MCQGRASEQDLGSAEASPQARLIEVYLSIAPSHKAARGADTFPLRNHQQQQLLILTRQSSAGRGLEQGCKLGWLIPVPWATDLQSSGASSQPDPSLSQAGEGHREGGNL